jgi:hypothetical protein
VRNHFAIPPFTFLEMKNVPGAHVVLNSPDVMGGPLSQAQFFTTTKFAAHLFKVGTLKTMPKAFTDYYLPVAHDLKGS